MEGQAAFVEQPMPGTSGESTNASKNQGVAIVGADIFAGGAEAGVMATRFGHYRLKAY